MFFLKIHLKCLENRRARNAKDQLNASSFSAVEQCSLPKIFPAGTVLFPVLQWSCINPLIHLQIICRCTSIKETWCKFVEESFLKPRNEGIAEFMRLLASEHLKGLSFKCVRREKSDKTSPENRKKKKEKSFYLIENCFLSFFNVSCTKGIRWN